MRTILCLFLGCLLLPSVLPAQSFELKYVPPNATVVFLAKPSKMFQPPVFRKMLDAMGFSAQMEERFGVKPESLETAIVFANVSPEGDRSKIAGGVLRTTDAFDWNQALSNSPWRIAFQVLDDRTVAVMSDSTALEKYLEHIDKNLSPEWAGDLTALNPTEAALVMNLEKMQPQRYFRRRFEFQAMASPVSPIWEESKWMVATASVLGNLQLQAVLRCESEPKAQRVQETLNALLVLTRNAVRGTLSQLPRELDAEQRLAFTVGKQILNSLLSQVSITQEGTKVIADVPTDMNVAQTAGLLYPLMEQQLKAANRMRSTNKLKQVALALHNYHSVHGHFPPPVLIHPQTKVPYSWRVAILPYLEQQALYERYDFSKPWDAEENRFVRETEIPIYSGMQKGTNHTSMYFLVGEGAIFSNQKDAAKLFRIRDGSSNTLMVVESKRDTPWAKPEDITYDPSKDPPKLGGFFEGGFNAAFADGSVQFISDQIDKELLHRLIQAADGKVIQLDR